MRMAMRETPWPQGKHPSRPCPVCGQGWVPWAFSLLPCHGRCLFRVGEQLTILFDPRQVRLVATEYGVTTSVINATRGAARELLKEFSNCKHRWSQLYDDAGKEVERSCPKCGCGCGEVTNEHLFASQRGLNAVLSVLVHKGDMCPKCGHGTRVTSKNWARCKKCNERVPRRELPA